MPLFFNMPISSLKTTNKKTLKHTKNHGVFNKKHVVFQCYFSSPVLEVHTLMTPCFVSTGKTVGKNTNEADFLSPGQTLAHGLQQGVCFPVGFCGFPISKETSKQLVKIQVLTLSPILVEVENGCTSNCSFLSFRGSFPLPWLWEKEYANILGILGGGQVPLWIHSG